MKVPDVNYGERGLMPGIVQDAATGRVLMLGYLNQEALDLTVVTGLVHFWSRARNRLWRKGETSGNSLQLVDLSVDCDADALLLTVRPAGPTCHTGSVTCFDNGRTDGEGFARLETLWSVIATRAEELPADSYTARLVSGGVDATGRKVIEEAGEVVKAASQHSHGSGTAARVAEEAADVVYHLLVLLAERGVQPRQVLDELDTRRR